MALMSIEDFNTKISDMQEKLDDPDFVMGTCLELMDAFGAVSKSNQEALTNVGKLTTQTDSLRARNMELFRQIGTKVVSETKVEEDDEDEVKPFDSIIGSFIKSAKIK